MIHKPQPDPDFLPNNGHTVDGRNLAPPGMVLKPCKSWETTTNLNWFSRWISGCHQDVSHQAGEFFICPPQLVGNPNTNGTNLLKLCRFTKLIPLHQIIGNTGDPNEQWEVCRLIRLTAMPLFQPHAPRMNQVNICKFLFFGANSKKNHARVFQFHCLEWSM